MITLQFARGQGIGGKLIEWFDHGRYAHVDIVMEDGTLLGARNDSMESLGVQIPAGVRIRPRSYLDGIEKLQVWIPAPRPVSEKFYQFALAQVGKEYDSTAIAGFVAGRDWSQADAWFCSELVAAALMESGYIHKLAAPANKIAPDDLLLVVSAFVDINAHQL